MFWACFLWCQESRLGFCLALPLGFIGLAYSHQRRCKCLILSEIFFGRSWLCLDLCFGYALQFFFFWSSDAIAIKGGFTNE